MLTAPTWTYSAAGGPNPFVMPVKGGLVATAVNTESGSVIVGLGRSGARFVCPLALEPRGVAIFAQPSPGTLAEHVWVAGYSTAAGVAPRLFCIDRTGEIRLDLVRPEIGWREGRTLGITETATAIVLHVDDRHLVMGFDGQVWVNVPRPNPESAYIVDDPMLYAYDGRAIVRVDFTNGETVPIVAVDGRPSAIRPDAARGRIAVRMDRVLLSVDMDRSAGSHSVRALLGGLHATPTMADANLRAIVGPPAGVECVDDDGVPRWAVTVPGATGVYGAGFLVGGEAVLMASHTSGDRVLIVRDGDVIFERPRAGAAGAAGALARVGERAAVLVSPGADASALMEFAGTIDVVSMRGGGSVAYERPTRPGPGKRLVVVDAAGARVVDVSEGGGGGRWAAASDGLIGVPRTNTARIDLYDTGAPA